MLMPDTLAVALLPALSVAVPDAEFVPLLLSVTASGQVAIPDRLSPQVKWTFTGPVYQPLLPTVPLTIDPVMLGAVLSSLTVTLSVPTLPAVSVAEPSTSWPAVSVETVTGAVTLATPDPASSSLAVNVTVVSLLFQPFAFAVGLSVCVTVGAMLSHCRATAPCVSTLPALSTD